MAGGTVRAAILRWQEHMALQWSPGSTGLCEVEMTMPTVMPAALTILLIKHLLNANALHSDCLALSYLMFAITL